jgi:hypothetical protein
MHIFVTKRGKVEGISLGELINIILWLFTDFVVSSTTTKNFGCPTMTAFSSPACLPQFDLPAP